MSQSDMEEEVVLTPLKSPDSAVRIMRIERVPGASLDSDKVQHIAGGPYKGIVVNKATDERPTPGAPDATRDFFAYVQNPNAGGAESRESRVIKIWFQTLPEDNEDGDRLVDAFFKEVIHPDHFPKDYVSFLKRMLNIVRAYKPIAKVELEVKAVPENEAHGQETSVNSRVSQNDVQHETTVSATAGDTATISTDVTSASYRRVVKTTIIKRGGPDGETTVEEEKKVSTDDGNVTVERKSMSGADYYARNAGMSNAVDENENRTINQGSPRTPNGTEENNNWQSGGRDQEDVLNEESLDVTMRGSLSGSGTGGTASLGSRSSRHAPPPSVPSKNPETVWESKKMRTLGALEDAFPNALRMEDISKMGDLKHSEIETILRELESRGLVRELERSRWMRVTVDQKQQQQQQEQQKHERESRSKRTSFNPYSPRSPTAKGFPKTHDFQVVAHVPMLSDHEQPTVAIITLLYCEKQAVDAMMDHKTTYVRLKTDGEGQVYTVGVIGHHRVVTTKLARVGAGQGAMLSAGNNATRLLGTFGKIEHVILVGVAGSIPSAGDQTNVRLGDVVVSKAEYTGGPVYVYVNDVDVDATGGISFGTQSWGPKEDAFPSIIDKLHDKTDHQAMVVNANWEKFIREGLKELEKEHASFNRPPQESDRLYKIDKDGSWLEIEHPLPQPDSERALNPDAPVAHLGVIGGGFQRLVNDGSDKRQRVCDRRQEFAAFNEIKALDSGFQAVMDSIEGNRKDSFMIIRGIADYMDGMTQGVTQVHQWQPYSSVVAAAYMKAILMQVPAA